MQQLNRGVRLTELLKQDQYQPLSTEKQIAVIYAGTNGFLDDLEVEQILTYEAELLDYLDTGHAGLLSEIRDKGQLDDKLEGKLKGAISEFTAQFKEKAGNSEG